MPLVALLDANVLWSAAVRDTMLRAAEKDLFRPAWTMEILEEMTRSLKRERPDLDPVRIERIAVQITACFPEALIEGYQELIPAMRNHQQDRHVLAAAVLAGASIITTWNQVHFPAEALGPYNIQLQSPDEFLNHLWYLHPEEMVEVLQQQAEALANPPQTTMELLETLRRSVPQFVDAVANSGLLQDGAA